MAKIIIETMGSEEIKKRGISRWPVWEKEVSRFDWYYESTEQCLILEGDITVETSEGNYHIKQGDFVTFMQGLECVWDIKKPVKKHYHFE